MGESKASKLGVAKIGQELFNTLAASHSSDVRRFRALNSRAMSISDMREAYAEPDNGFANETRCHACIKIHAFLLPSWHFE